MCLAFLGWNVHPDYAAVVLFNRDEFLARPSDEPDWWPDSGVFGPRDPVGKGTWIGLSSHTGNFAFLTNFREENGHLPKPVSRGAVVSNFLAEDIGPGEYVQRLTETDDMIGGYNAVLGNLHTGELWSHSNRGDQGSAELGKGLHAVSNGRMSDLWPKMRTGLERLAPLLTTPVPETDDREYWEVLFDVMKDQERCAINEVPITGMPPEDEQAMSSAFIHNINIRGKPYGTRSQTVLLAKHDGDVWWHERTRTRDEPEPDGLGWETSHHVIYLEDIEPEDGEEEEEQDEL
eukprot:jgi/Ulvmu1/4577/UM002_0305.1